MSTEGGPNRKTTIEAIVVAFAHSSMKDLVGSDALRTVVSGQYPDINRDGTINLEPVWALLSDQPGFDREAALPPFCALKSWEKHLSAPVILPPQLGELSPTEIMAHASHCPVPKGKRLALFDPDRKRSGNTIGVEYITAEQELEGPAKQAPTRRPALEAALALVALLGLGFGGYSIVGYLTSPGFEEINLGDLGSTIPVEKSKRLGADLTLEVNDSSWYDSPEEHRKKDLEDALVQLEAEGIKSIVVLDRQGKVRASAQWGSSPSAVVTRFH